MKREEKRGRREEVKAETEEEEMIGETEEEIEGAESRLYRGKLFYCKTIQLQKIDEERIKLHEPT